MYSGKSVKFSNPSIPQLCGTLPPELEAVEMQRLPEKQWCEPDPEERLPTTEYPTSFSTSPGSMDTLDPEPYPEAWVAHITVTPDLNASEQQQMEDLLNDFADLFSDTIGRSNQTQHHIELLMPDVVNVKPYRHSPEKKRVIQEEVQQMLRDGEIEPSNKPLVLTRGPRQKERRWLALLRGL